MAEYFNNPKDLMGWVKSRGSYDEAANTLINMIKTDKEHVEGETDIVNTCQEIFENKNDNASEILFGILAKNNITTLEKRANVMNKKAQSRQRNNWSRGQRNKWNRATDGFNEATPWRIGRDKYFDFTHNAIDEIKFDEDPNHIYSGEAIWRTYVMDKFYRDYKDENGMMVGGYINDRFYRFPTAGTPDNPDAPRHGGNSMGLADGERTRQPRPHEYSIERRMEEARGNKTKSITASKNKKQFSKILKIASNKSLKEAKNDRIFNMFKDTIEMREEGIEYGTMLTAISDHYGASIHGVAQIDKVAQKLIKKHNDVGYEMKKAATLYNVMQYAPSSNMIVNEPDGVDAYIEGREGTTVPLEQGTNFVNVPGRMNVFQITDHPSDPNLVGANVSFRNMDFDVTTQSNVQEAADELGLNEQQMEQVKDAVQTDETIEEQGHDFEISRI